MNLINLKDTKDNKSDSKIIDNLNSKLLSQYSGSKKVIFWKTLCLLQTFVISAVYYFGTYGSLGTKMAIRYWLFDEEVSSYLDNVEQLSTAKQIKTIENNLSDSTPNITINTNISEKSGINWKTVALGSGLIILLAISVATFAQIHNLSTVQDLQFEHLSKLLKTDTDQTSELVKSIVTNNQKITEAQTNYLQQFFIKLEDRLISLIRLEAIPKRILGGNSSRSSSISDIEGNFE